MAKKAIYIILWMILGIILQFIVHALLEMGYLHLLLKNFERYSFGFSWADWFYIHHAFTVVLLGIGMGAGLQQGFFWWKRLYE